LAQLRASSIGDDIILERGYETVRTLAKRMKVLVDRGFFARREATPCSCAG